MSWFITNFIAAFLLPPLSLLLLLAVGFYVWHKRPSLARLLIGTAIVLLWLLSTPYVADSGLRWLESYTQPLSLPVQGKMPDAIVILGGGTYFSAPEFGGEDAIGEMPLMRLRYGAMLHRVTGKPILVSGGMPLGNTISEASLMKASLQTDFQVPVRWVEDGSNNTFDNARLSFADLSKQGIHNIYLVTHAWHMPRSAQVFRRAGFEVIEAPTAFNTSYRVTLLTFIPSVDALRDSRIVVHEMIGLAWYQLRQRM